MIEIGDLKLFTVEELSERLDIQERTLRDYLRVGRLRGRKLAGRWYITEDALREYFSQSEPNGEEQHEPG